MEKKVLVKVTQAHIDKSLKRNKRIFCTCPIEIALHEMGFKKAVVHHSLYRLTPMAISDYLPYKACMFILRFDSFMKVKPFQFYIRPPKKLKAL